MGFRSPRRTWPYLLLLFAVVVIGCKSRPEPEPQYTDGSGAVGFDVALESGPHTMEKSTRWLATYESEGRTARFRIDFEAGTTSSGGFKTVFGKGRITAVPGSDAGVLIKNLKTALEAKTLPTQTARVESLPFTYAILGGDLYRETHGGFGGRKGNWTALKLFFGDNNEGEVYLNLNPVLGKGEFSIKDPDYGDYVVAQLGKVL